jgi:hypothetical protein
MTHEVTWTQWFFDFDGEKDCETMKQSFESLEEAEKFVDELVDPTNRYFGNLSIHRDDVTITKK